MELEITNREENALFDREEVELVLKHASEATPSANDVRKKLAAELDVDPRTIEVDTITSSKGVTHSRARVKVHAEPVVDALPEEDTADDEEADEQDSEDEETESEDDEDDADEESEDAESDEDDEDTEEN